MRDRVELRRRAGRIGLRWRITIAFLGAALAVSALVAGTTYLVAEEYLTRQRVDDAVQQAFSNMRFATTYLAQTEGDDPLADLVQLLPVQGSGEALIVTPEGEYFPSSVSITPASVPTELERAVAADGVGYALEEEQQKGLLVFGSRIPTYYLPDDVSRPLRAYFFFPFGDLQETLEILRNVLLIVSAGAVGLAALAGTRVSGRVVDPVRRASRAARRVAEGLLETRLPVSGRDELAALATSFNEMAAALEERIARERRFVGDVSHELRTPLTTLRTSTEYVLEHATSLSPDVRRAAELLAADLEYLERLVNDLLDLSRVEAGRVDMAWERLNLADLTREVVAVRTRHGSDKVRVEVETEPSELSTIADKQRLERVVGNLVDNALMHGDGSEVTLRLNVEDGALLLSVEDQGPGVPPAERDRIFERFYKADPARHRGDGRGSGLGLAIARENAHLHGGEIEVGSANGRGARFLLRLPRREEEPVS